MFVKHNMKYFCENGGDQHDQGHCYVMNVTGRSLDGYLYTNLDKGHFRIKFQVSNKDSMFSHCLLLPKSNIHKQNTETEKEQYQ